MTIDDFCRQSTAARIFGLSRQAINSALRRGRLTCISVGGVEFIYLPSLLKWRRSIPENRIRGPREPVIPLKQLE